MSDITDRLHTLRRSLAGVSTLARLIPAIDHALALAAEVEYEADRASNLALINVEPKYPPLVQLLADAAVEGSRERDIRDDQLSRIESLTRVSDDGSRWPHRSDCSRQPGDADEQCPGCWSEAIQQVLRF